MSKLTCACIGCMNIWAPYWNWWAGICIIFPHQWWCIWAYSLVRALVVCTSERCTKLGHICCVEVGSWWCLMNTCLNQQPWQQLSPSCACIDVLHNWALTFSPHWSQGLCVKTDEAVVGELGSASYLTIIWQSFLSILTCACTGVMHIWALYWNWAHVLLWLQCTTVTRYVS